MRRIILFTALLCAAGLLAGQGGRADDKKKDAPDEKALIEAMMKAGTPGDAHKKLETTVGSWELVVKMWMDPSKPADESKATSERKWILGGRFVEEKVTGEFGGMKFEGGGVMGYDNLKKKYTGAWIDNMSTGIIASEGTYDADKKTFTFTNESPDFTTGKTKKGKDVLTIVDKDKFELDSYSELGGKEVKSMHITYTRKK
jgi:hypothetical protein